MRHDDRHVRKIHRDVVDRHRVAVFQPDTTAARHACADAAVAGVKEDRQPASANTSTADRPRDRWGRIAESVDGASAHGSRPNATRRRASRTPAAPRAGSMLAKGNGDVRHARRHFDDAANLNLSAVFESNQCGIETANRTSASGRNLTTLNRTNVELKLGSNVQAWDADLDL